MDGLLVYLVPILVVLVWLDVRMLSRQLRDVHEELRRIRIGLGQVSPPGLEPSDEVRALAVEPGSRIEAIRRYRQQSGADVQSAVAVVDRIGAARPEA